jgi:ethanolamine transporter EutH
MKKNILTFGLISGLIVSGLISITAICYQRQDFEGNMILGFSVMILAFAFIFVGIKNYRDKFNNGMISFGKASQIGLSIALIASTMYVLTWLIAYYNFMPDFMEVMTAQNIEKLKLDKQLTNAEMTSKIAEINNMKELYKSPLMVVLFTYLEIFPIGIIVTLISALILKRKQPAAQLA